MKVADKTLQEIVEMPFSEAKKHMHKAGHDYFGTEERKYIAEISYIETNNTPIKASSLERAKEKAAEIARKLPFGIVKGLKEV